MIRRQAETGGRTRRARRGAVAAALLAGALATLLGGCDKIFPHHTEGEQLYLDNCADCHGVDGRGNTAREMGQPFADLTDDVWKFGGDDSSIANVIREGSFGLMPGFQEKLSDQQVQALVAYLRVLHKRAGASQP
jgi:cytochrome c oxidase cbb3-type subunit 3